jgi:hypothetical protein
MKPEKPWPVLGEALFWAGFMTLIIVVKRCAQ